MLHADHGATMTCRFLAIIGETELQAARQFMASRFPSLTPFEISPETFVLVDAGLTMYVLSAGGGCVIGTLFHRNGASVPLERLDEGDAHAIIRTGGRHLIERFWGRYIALLRLADGSLAVRDPSGMLPCVYTSSASCICLASEPGVLAEADLLRPAVDDDGLGRALLFPGFPEERTALKNLKNLRPGTALQWRNGISEVKNLWHPWDFVSKMSEKDNGAQAERLGRVIQQCVSGWSRLQGRGLMCVSGGLDSSIVASALTRAGNDLSCLTLVTADKLGDERAFGTKLADHLGLELTIDEYDIADIRLDISSVAHQAKPFGRIDALAYDAALVRTARQTAANCIFSGLGGDNVFYMSHSARPIVDRFLTEGLSAGTWASVCDIAALTGESAFKVTWHAFGNWRRRDEPYGWKPNADYLSPNVVAKHLADQANHPWLALPTGVRLPGKSAQIAMLLRMQHSIDAYLERGGTPIVHPLVSQPVIECSLGIPTWLQSRGGRDRAVARQAFEAYLPREIIYRRLKGSPQGFIQEIFRHFRSEIRERLLDGYLVASGIADRRLLEVAFNRTTKHDGVSVLRLLLLVDTESWIRHWQAQSNCEKFVSAKSNMRSNERDTWSDRVWS